MLKNIKKPIIIRFGKLTYVVFLIISIHLWTHLIERQMQIHISVHCRTTGPTGGDLIIRTHCSQKVYSYVLLKTYFELICFESLFSVEFPRTINEFCDVFLATDLQISRFHSATIWWNSRFQSSPSSCDWNKKICFSCDRPINLYIFIRNLPMNYVIFFRDQSPIFMIFQPTEEIHDFLPTRAWCISRWKER